VLSNDCMAHSFLESILIKQFFVMTIFF